jgi:hypothetical protein
MAFGRGGAALVLAVVVLAVGALLAGCFQSSAPEPPPGDVDRWREPPRYSYTLDSACGERALYGRFRVTVVDGTVTAVEGLDEPAKWYVESGNPTVPTLAALLAAYRKARDSDAGTAEASFDPVDGHPTRITIDPIKNAIDDEQCYVITEYST